MKILSPLRSWALTASVCTIALLVLFQGIPASVLAATENIWGTVTPPAKGADQIAYELGTVFSVTVPGTVTAVRLYTPSGESGSHTIRLWNNTTGMVIGGPYALSTSGTGWKTYTLTTEVAITTGTSYTISVTTGGYSTKTYAYQGNALTQAGSNGQHITYPANAGVFTTTLGTRPTQTYRSANYFCDIVFTPSTTPLPTAPSPLPGLPTGFDSYAPPVLTTSASPVIADHTKIAMPNDTVALIGDGLVGGGTTKFRLFGQTTSSNITDVTVNPLLIDAISASALLPTSLPARSMYLMWPVNGTAYGEPVAINRTESWWIGPNQAAPDESTAIYGRNLADAANPLTQVYLKPTGTASGQWIAPTSSNPYRIEFTVPSLTPGSYEVWVHNGHGGNLGWGGPLTLTVRATPLWSGYDAHVFNVKNYGAKGDGVTDDHAAINNALNAAAAAAPSTLYFPASTYMTSDGFFPPSYVRWLGDGKDATFVKMKNDITSYSGAYGLLFNESGSSNNIEFANMTFDTNGFSTYTAPVHLRNDSNLHFTNIRLKATNSNTFDLHSSTNVMIENCELIGAGMFTGTGRQIRMNNNLFRMTNDGDAFTSWGGSELSLEGNTFQDYDQSSTAGYSSGRMFVTQGHWGSISNVYIGGNHTIDYAASVYKFDQNSGEHILFEIYTNRFSGPASAGTPTTVTLPTYTAPPGSPVGLEATIINSKGVGQHRVITAYDSSSKVFTVSPAWKVTPDTTSVVGIGSVQKNTVAYRNTLQGKADYATRSTASTGIEPWGNLFDFVADSNDISRTRGGVSHFVTGDQPGVAPTNFNLFLNNTIHDVYAGINLVTAINQTNTGVWTPNFGNVYRNTTIQNVTSDAVHMAFDQGANLDMTVFEHNSAVNTHSGFLTFSPYPGSPVFLNTVLIDNHFDRGTAPLSGSVGMLAATGTMWYSGNTFVNFASGNAQPLTNGNR